MIEIAKYTTNATGVLPTFNSGYTGYTVDEIDNGDGTYNVEINTDSSDILPTTISFYGKTELLKVEYLNVSAVTSMSNMFRNCNNLTFLDLSGFDTGKVTNMTSMFHGCKNLTSLDLSGFDASKVTIMNSMFYDCNSLTSLDLSGFDTGKVTNMGSMFKNCSKLTSLDVSGWDTSAVTNMSSMFSGCSQLITVYLFNSSASTINNFIYYLPTKTSVTPGEIFISDNVSISSVDVTSANIKDWNIVIVTESIDDNAIKKVYYCYVTVSKISIGSKTIKHIYTYTIKE